MRMLKMLTHSCVLYSAAMLLNEEPQNLAKEIGHDGLAVRWPEQTGAARLQGISMQEIQDVCIGRGFGLVKIDALPYATPAEGIEAKPVYSLEEAQARFNKIITDRRGILIGQTASGMMHAVAWDGHQCYDPVGRVYPTPSFGITEAWLLASLER